MCIVGFLHMAFVMFLIVKYMGQALLSDDRIRGAMVDLIGKLFFHEISH